MCNATFLPQKTAKVSHYQKIDEKETKSLDVEIIRRERVFDPSDGCIIAQITA